MKPPQRDQYREFLKDTIRQTIDFSQTDQYRAIPAPPIAKPFSPDAARIGLVRPGQWKDIGHIDLEAAVGRRRSRRSFTREPLTVDELSFLLWATQGVQRQLGDGTALRTVPSAGARHALETYLGVLRVEGLEPGFYRYLPLEHHLLLEYAEPRAGEKLIDATMGQSFTGRSAVTWIWTTIPYRMEWRYGLAAHKAIALDAGHVCQNLYLACEAIGCGVCAVAAYDQEKTDRLLRVDGADEFAVYLAAVGKI